MKQLFSILLLFVFTQCVLASDDVVIIDGESFANTFVGSPPNGDKLVEFMRKGETFENWTKLVGYRYQHLSRLDNDPQKAALGLERIVKQNNPKAQTRVITNKRTNEAIIDFLTWPKDGKYMEFNVFRYAKSLDGNAVISLQLAYRFTDTSAQGIKKIKKIRAAWVSQAATYDMSKIHAYLNP